MSTPDSSPPKAESNSPENQVAIQQSDSPVDAKSEGKYSDQSVLASSSGGQNESAGDQGGEEEEEEQGECGFCLFMKAGGCRDAFIDWENCITEAEKNKEDIVDKCAEATSALKKCMEAHSDYYEPILRAEKAAEQEAIIELEKEKQAEVNRSEQHADQSGLEKKKEAEAAKGSEKNAY